MGNFFEEVCFVLLMFLFNIQFSITNVQDFCLFQSTWEMHYCKPLRKKNSKPGDWPLDGCFIGGGPQ